MEEEQKEETFQPPREFESRLSRGKAPQSPSKKGFIILFSIIVLGLLLFGVTRFFGGKGSEQNTPTPTPTVEVLPTDTLQPTESDVTPTQKPTNTPTPKPTVNPIDKASGLDRSKLSIHVLNGSGVAGSSKKASDYLEGLGYNVIQIGNADNFNYEKTTIQIKSAKNTYFDLLEKDLSSNYSMGTTSADLSDSNNADAVVTVGKQ